MNLVFATHNAHKLEEVRALFEDQDVHLQPLSEFPDLPEPPETGDTFVANALQKARFIHSRLGVPVVADDSGLVVDALGGAPGVHSKRFSPEATAEGNNRLLLARMTGVQERRARFVCVVALVADGVEETVEGRCEGRIAHALQGTGGFGYDPLFLPDALPGRAMAQATLAEKNAISHRGLAFAHLPALVRRHLG